MPRQTSVQLTESTERQAAALKTAGFGSLTDIIRIAIDRMYQQEIPTMSEATQTTHYNTHEDAEADGWTRIVPAGWTKKDTSGYNSFGYEFTATSPDGTRQAVTTGLWIRNATNRMGKPGAIVNFYRVEDFA